MGHAVLLGIVVLVFVVLLCLLIVLGLARVWCAVVGLRRRRAPARDAAPHAATTRGDS